MKTALARAAADGNDAAVGPLGRDEVDAVFADEPPLPLLALNRGARAPAAGSAAFSLSPEAVSYTHLDVYKRQGTGHWADLDAGSAGGAH